MICWQTTEHLAGGRKEEIDRTGREEFTLEQNDDRTWRASGDDLEVTLQKEREEAAEMAMARVASVARIVRQGKQKDGVGVPMTAGYAPMCI